MTDVTLTACWKHHGGTPPYRVQTDTLDTAAEIAESRGWSVLGSANGYSVQENESDVSLTVRPNIDWLRTPAILAAALTHHTGREWRVATDG